MHLLEASFHGRTISIAFSEDMALRNRLIWVYTVIPDLAPQVIELFSCSTQLSMKQTAHNYQNILH